MIHTCDEDGLVM